MKLIVSLEPRGWRNWVRWALWPPFRKCMRRQEKLVNLALTTSEAHERLQAAVLYGFGVTRVRWLNDSKLRDK